MLMPTTLIIIVSKPKIINSLAYILLFTLISHEKIHEIYLSSQLKPWFILKLSLVNVLVKFSVSRN